MIAKQEIKVTEHRPIIEIVSTTHRQTKKRIATLFGAVLNISNIEVVGLFAITRLAMKSVFL